MLGFFCLEFKLITSKKAIFYALQLPSNVISLIIVDRNLILDNFT